MLLNRIPVKYVFFSRYMFDEPSSYLDVKQRLKAALAIRGLSRENKYVVMWLTDVKSIVGWQLDHFFNLDTVWVFFCVFSVIKFPVSHSAMFYV